MGDEASRGVTGGGDQLENLSGSNTGQPTVFCSAAERVGVGLCKSRGQRSGLWQPDGPALRRIIALIFCQGARHCALLLAKKAWLELEESLNKLYEWRLGWSHAVGQAR